jgi:hypothetical protein
MNGGAMNDALSTLPLLAKVAGLHDRQQTVSGDARMSFRTSRELGALPVKNPPVTFHPSRLTKGDAGCSGHKRTTKPVRRTTA